MLTKIIFNFTSSLIISVHYILKIYYLHNMKKGILYERRTKFLLITKMGLVLKKLQKWISRVTMTRLRCK